MSNSYYVYALKDPRSNPAKIFYIGKGTGSRDEDHIIKVDKTRKGIFIKQIINSGHNVVVTRLIENLNESDALKIESELIASLGTIDAGGMLYNTVIPTNIIGCTQKDINIPVGIFEKAQIGIKLMKDAIEELVKVNSKGITNSDCAHSLGLQSDHEGQQQNYLTYSVLGILLKENRIIGEKIGNNKKYKCTKN